jgi:hypothetical protein
MRLCPFVALGVWPRGVLLSARGFPRRVSLASSGRQALHRFSVEKTPQLLPVDHSRLGNKIPSLLALASLVGLLSLALGRAPLASLRWDTKRSR